MSTPAPAHDTRPATADFLPLYSGNLWSHAAQRGETRAREDRRKIGITGKMQINVVTCCQNSDKADLLLQFQRKYIAEVKVPFYKSTRLK